MLVSVLATFRATVASVKRVGTAVRSAVGGFSADELDRLDSIGSTSSTSIALTTAFCSKEMNATSTKLLVAVLSDAKNSILEYNNCSLLLLKR